MTFDKLTSGLAVLRAIAYVTQPQAVPLLETNICIEVFWRLFLLFMNVFLFVYVIVIYADIKPNTDSGSAEGVRSVVTLLFIDQALLQCPSFMNT